MVSVMHVIVSLRGFALAVALVGAAAGCRLQTQQVPVAVEARAADFELPAHDGRIVTLAELVARGPAILVFYRGYW
jgi:cytochrome oxidase Cu insertion factor (SCO1/SenC/PrrC family)